MWQWYSKSPTYKPSSSELWKIQMCPAITLYYCTFQVALRKSRNVFLIFCFLCFTCMKCIINLLQYYIASCVSLLLRLTLLDLQIGLTAVLSECNWFICRGLNCGGELSFHLCCDYPFLVHESVVFSRIWSALGPSFTQCVSDCWTTTLLSCVRCWYMLHRKRKVSSQKVGNTYLKYIQPCSSL